MILMRKKAFLPSYYIIKTHEEKHLCLLSLYLYRKKNQYQVIAMIIQQCMEIRILQETVTGNIVYGKAHFHAVRQSRSFSSYILVVCFIIIENYIK